MNPVAPTLSWLQIVRLGLVQACLGAIVVLTTSVLNRVMVNELQMLAIVPGFLVTLHHALQLSRPKMGHGSDRGRRRTPWIVGGMAVLAAGAAVASLATALMSSHRALGIALAAVGYLAIGAGVSAAGTSLLVLMAKRVGPSRRAAGATIVWLMMIMGFGITTGILGKLLDPYGPARLAVVALCVCALAFAISVVAIIGVEAHGKDPGESDDDEKTPGFSVALAQVWSERDARRFTLFIVLAMLSYSAQDLVLEPFAGAVFSYTLGQSTSLSSTQHQGVFVGMVLVAVITSTLKTTILGSLRGWVIGGCLASAAALFGLVLAGLAGGAGQSWPLQANVFFLGAGNGAFSIAAIGSMMALAHRGVRGHAGVRMGVWGAAQSIAMGAGGFLGTVVAAAAAVVGLRTATGYVLVFALEVVGFVVAASLARGIASSDAFMRRESVLEALLPERARPAREPV
jgi:MFS transporter, BCD family, chlorophyll transporter